MTKAIHKGANKNSTMVRSAIYLIGKQIDLACKKKILMQVKKMRKVKLNKTKRIILMEIVKIMMKEMILKNLVIQMIFSYLIKLKL